jgi:hypothetical protein
MAFQEPKKLMQWLPAAEWWYNCSYHTSIQMSPFEALYEYKPPLLHQVSIPCNISADAQVTLQEKDHMLKSFQANLLKAQNRMKKYADANKTERSLEEGYFVYLKMQPYRETALGLQNALKLTSKWYGPFLILQKIGNVAYHLQLPLGSQIHDVFHVNQLKKHLGKDAIPNPKLPMVSALGKIKVAPSQVLQHRLIPRSNGEYDIAVPQWMIHWKNLTEVDAMWEMQLLSRKHFPISSPQTLPQREGGG